MWPKQVKFWWKNDDHQEQIKINICFCPCPGFTGIQKEDANSSDQDTGRSCQETTGGWQSHSVTAHGHYLY